MDSINDQMDEIAENNPTCPDCDPDWHALQDLFNALGDELSPLQDKCGSHDSQAGVTTSNALTAGAQGEEPSIIATGTPTSGVAF